MLVSKLTLGYDRDAKRNRAEDLALATAPSSSCGRSQCASVVTSPPTQTQSLRAPLA